MRICIVGAGYVGLVSGVGFAELGHEVTLVEIDRKKVDMINRGESPIHEKGVEPLLKVLVPRSLKATLELGEGIRGAEVIFLCVQSSSSDNESLDLRYIEKASADIGLALRDHDERVVFVIKSTVTPGTTRNVVIPLVERYSGKVGRDGVAVMTVPEFLREGSALEDFRKPYRIVVGGSNEWGKAVLHDLYKAFNVPFVWVDLTTAEMIKCASNAFLATKVSFVNEIGNICKQLGVDVYKVAEGMGADPRISPHHMNAGIGFGGSCLPKDTRNLVSLARKCDYEPSLLESVLRINEEQPLRLVKLADQRVGGLRDRDVAVLGLAFKAGTDDTRKAPAIKVINALCERGARVRVYDPVAEERGRVLLGDAVKYCPSASEAVSAAELVLILTEWDEFQNLDLYKGKIVLDGRGLLRSCERNGMEYEGICW